MLSYPSALLRFRLFINALTSDGGMAYYLILVTNITLRRNTATPTADTLT